MVTSPTVDMQRFLLQLVELGNEVTQAMTAATREPEFVDNSSLQVLCLLDLEGPQRPRAIQDLVGLSSGGTSKLLDRMEVSGLVKRSYGVITDDYRGVEVAITPKGRTLIRRATKALGDHLPQARALVRSMVELLDQNFPDS